MNVQTHLDGLAAGEGTALREVVARLRRLPEREAPKDFETRVMAAVETAEARRTERRRGAPSPWLGGAAAAAAAVALIALSCLLSSLARRGAADESGVAWLAATQETDGTWDPAAHGGVAGYRPALTALSALALADNGAYGAQVEQACAALAAMQGADGSFGGEGRVAWYNQSIVLLALAELGEAATRPALERAVAFVAAGQTAQGGWDYEPGSEGNAAVTAWQVRALARAAERGIATAEVPLRKGLRWLRGTARDDGSVAYHRGTQGRSEGLTALAGHALVTAAERYPELGTLGRRVVASLDVGGAEDGRADYYRDYARVMALAATGDNARAGVVRERMRAWQQAGAHDQWEPVGGGVYVAAITALAHPPRPSL